MNKFNNLIILFSSMVFGLYDPITQALVTKQTTHISPEIVSELKDFENLIPTATIEEIIAKHYVLDGSFRTALKYLRSPEFTELQKQLLNIPEIINILEFLHVTTTNATTRHMSADAYKRVVTMTTNAATTNNFMLMENVKEALNNERAQNKPQPFQMTKEKNKYAGIDVEADDDEANNIAGISNEQPLVRIVLFDGLEVNATAHNEGQHNQYQYHHHHKHHRQRNNNYHHHASPLGSFTSFVDEILQHLPHSSYQEMISDKCTKNENFAEFYKALRSPEFQPLVNEAMSTVNIKKVIETLKSYEVDVKSLTPIAFKVIGWGPNI